MNPKYPHLISALLAIPLALGLLAYGTSYAQSLEQKYIHVLAPFMLPQSNVGSALQQAAFQQSDLLVVYGSSEMLVENTPYRAFQFFQNYPTGFDVYEVAKGGVTSLASPRIWPPLVLNCAERKWYFPSLPACSMPRKSTRWPTPQTFHYCTPML